MSVDTTLPTRRAGIRLRSSLSGLLILALVLGMAAAGVSTVDSVPVSASTPSTGSLDPAAGQYYSVTAVKVLDTRSGVGGTSGALSSGQTATFTVDGEGAIPASGVSAVYMVVSAISPTATGCLVDYAGGASDPGVCNTSFQSGQNTTDSDVVAVSSTGTVAVTNQASGTVQVAVSIVGYFGDGTSQAAGETYSPVTQQPILDTREGLGAPEAKVASGASLTLQITGNYGVPTDAAGVSVFLGAADGSTAGTLDAYPTGATDPALSLLSYNPGEIDRDFLFANLSSSGQLTVTNEGSASTDIIVNIAGYFVSPTGTEAGSTFTASTPSRILDTRNSTAVPANGSVSFTATGTGGIPTSGVTEVAESVAALSPQDTGWLSVYPEGTTDPDSPTVNFVAGDNQDNDLNAAVISSVSPSGEETITNHSSGTVEVVVSTRGYFTAAQAPSAPAFVTSAYSGGQATVSWTAPKSDGGAAVQSYVVTLGSGTSQTVSNTTEQATFTTGSSDTVTVKAVNAVGTGAATSSANVSGGTAGTYPQDESTSEGLQVQPDTSDDNAVVTSEPGTSEVGASNSAVDIPGDDVSTTDAATGITNNGSDAETDDNSGTSTTLTEGPQSDSDATQDTTSDDVQPADADLTNTCSHKSSGLNVQVYAPIYNTKSKNHDTVSQELAWYLVLDARQLTASNGSKYWTAQVTACGNGSAKSDSSSGYRLRYMAIEDTNEQSTNEIDSGITSGSTTDPMVASLSLGVDVGPFSASSTVTPYATKVEYGDTGIGSGLGLVPAGYEGNDVWSEWDGRSHPGTIYEGSDRPEAAAVVITYENPMADAYNYLIEQGIMGAVGCARFLGC